MKYKQPLTEGKIRGVKKPIGPSLGPIAPPPAPQPKGK